MNMSMCFCPECEDIKLHREIMTNIWECDCCGCINSNQSDLDGFDDEDTDVLYVDDDTISSGNLENSYRQFSQTSINLVKNLKNNIRKVV